LLRLRLYLGYGKWRALTSTTAAPRQWSPFRQGARPRLGHVLSQDWQLLSPSTSSGKYFSYWLYLKIYYTWSRR